MYTVTSRPYFFAGTTISIPKYEIFLEGQYCSLSARVLFLWDYCITLEDEIRCVWGRKPTVATVLYMLNRYVNLLITVMELLEQASLQTPQVRSQPPTCGPFIRVLQMLLVASMIIAGLFATLRVYAIWNCSWKPAMLILLLSMMSPIGSIVMYVSENTQEAPPPSVGCAIKTKLGPDMYSKLIIANRATVTAFEGVALLLTVARTLKIRSETDKLKLVTRLSTLMLRDGTVYFVALTVINITQIVVTSYVSENNFLSYYVAPLTSVLISRFLLDIRQIEPGEASASDIVTSSYHLDTLHFAPPPYTAFSSLAGEIGRGSPAITMVDYDTDTDMDKDMKIVEGDTERHDADEQCILPGTSVLMPTLPA